MNCIEEWRKILEENGLNSSTDIAIKPSKSIVETYRSANIYKKEVDVSAIPLSENEIFVQGGKLTFAYLRRARTEPERRRVHFTYCEKVKEIKHGKLFCTTQTDGKFEIDLEDESGQIEKTVGLELEPCRFCIGEYFGLHKWSDKEEKERIAKNFSYENISREIGLTLNGAVWYSRLYHYTGKTWKERSDEIREKANWTCQECNLHLGFEYKVFLHAHHLIGDRNFNHPANLLAICIKCHAEEPGHEDLKNTTQYKQFIKLLSAGRFDT